MKKYYEAEPLTLKDMRRGKWNKRLTKRITADKVQRFLDCGPMTEWEARWTIVGLVALGVLLTVAVLTLDQPPM